MNKQFFFRIALQLWL